LSETIIKKIPLILQTFFVVATLTFFTYYITVSTSKMTSHTVAYEAVVYTNQEDDFTLPLKSSVRKPYEPVKPRDPRAIKLERFLKIQQSELSEHADLLIELSDKYGIDYKIPVAIAGSESGYCNAAYFDNNCWGYGRFSWPTLEAGIKGYLSKMNVGYFKKGNKTIETIAPMYNSANTEEFITKVRHHYNLIP
jgi:hypothetical protein